MEQNTKLVKVFKLLESNKAKQALTSVKKLNANKSTKTYYSLIAEALCHIELNNISFGNSQLNELIQYANSEATLDFVCQNIYHAFRKINRFELAVEYLLFGLERIRSEKAIKIKWLLANCYLETGENKKAINLYKKLMVYKPYTVRSLKNLIAIGVTLSDFSFVQHHLRLMQGHIEQLNVDDLKLLIDRCELFLDDDIEPLLRVASSRGVNNSFILYMRARSVFKSGDASKTLTILQKIEPQHIDTFHLKLGFLSLKGKSYLALDDIDNAFSCFEQMNNQMASTFPDNWKSRDYLPKLRKLGSIPQRGPSKPFSFKLCFLVGFPRSGTTLLEHVLDSHSQVFALGEKVTIDAVIDKIIKDGYQYPEDLPKLSDDYLDELRQHYVDNISKYLGDSELSDYEVVLDKNPQLLMKLPLILMLFPDARILLAIRHPLDCIISCFQQNFHFRRNLAYFTDWESSFVRYRDVFDNYMIYRQQWQWNEHRVFYEQLTQNFEEQIGQIFEFLGIEMQRDEIMQYSQKSQKKIITTPSINQVKKGIYSNRSFNWEKHVNYIAPYWHEVKHHIEYFGYSTYQIEESIENSM
ncbi:tetratricopeptide repeat-containing sulfotransferase family protein [Neptunicella marina]|uniref:Sulfotransferase n=1 Tax=Neptunicella marina TaxID=2125989 RepID=A0A8J6M0M2_9ALTE|nr:sulfotransferase [Neptunicella marina]MBC3764932.1 sulfotransferase [Neptunicella marina]